MIAASEPEAPVGDWALYCAGQVWMEVGQQEKAVAEWQRLMRETNDETLKALLAFSLAQATEQKEHWEQLVLEYPDSLFGDLGRKQIAGRERS